MWYGYCVKCGDYGPLDEDKTCDACVVAWYAERARAGATLHVVRVA